MNAEDGRPCYCNCVSDNHHCEYGVVPDPAPALYRKIDCRDMRCRESIGGMAAISQNLNSGEPPERVRDYLSEGSPQAIE
jgi:hypothetical protein